MIISKTPLRISFAGGQTDIPEYYKNNTMGAVTNATINKYVYVTVNKKFTGKTRIVYKNFEEVEDNGDISHPIIRECLNYLGITDRLEITTVADIPGGTGLGSSSSFTVGLLNALHALYGKYKNPKELAEEACHIELDILKRHINVLKTLEKYQPMGIIKLSELTGYPQHMVRYSLRILEQDGLIEPSPQGAITTQGVSKTMDLLKKTLEDIQKTADELLKTLG